MNHYNNNISEEFLDDNIVIDEIKRQAQKAKILVDVEKKNIPLPKKIDKENVPELPNDLSDIPDSEIGSVYLQYESMCAWINYQIAVQNIRIRHGERLLGFARAKRMKSLKRGEIDQDEFYVNCAMDVDKLKGELGILESSYFGFERYAKAVSREITNRQNIRGRNV
jgi:hypothetical protein